MFTILPSTVWIRVAHPTEQNGQMLGVVLASLIRSSCARATAGARVTPSPARPPIAVPAPALPASRRKSRRLTCMVSSPREASNPTAGLLLQIDRGMIYGPVLEGATPGVRGLAAPP